MPLWSLASHLSECVAGLECASDKEPRGHRPLPRVCHPQTGTSGPGINSHRPVNTSVLNTLPLTAEQSNTTQHKAAGEEDTGGTERRGEERRREKGREKERKREKGRGEERKREKGRGEKRRQMQI